jgi:hypothetical protein
LKPFDRVEKLMGRFRRKIPGGSDSDREPVEIKRDILREIAEQVQPAGNGTYIFPYTSIAIEIYPRNPDERPVMEILFEPTGIEREVVEELKRRECRVKKLVLTTSIVENAAAMAGGVRHSLTYSCGTEAAQKPAIARLAARGSLARTEGQG